jgi:predicted transcriptional regulator
MSETLTVRLDDALAKALADEAERSSRPKGRIVAEALEAYFRRTRTSALQALQQYVGCMTGPSDLSTNRKHLATLGRRRRA